MLQCFFKGAMKNKMYSYEAALEMIKKQQHMKYPCEMEKKIWHIKRHGSDLLEFKV